jgi:titin
MKKIIVLFLSFSLTGCAVKAGSNPNTSLKAGSPGSGSSANSSQGAVQLNWVASSGTPSGYYIQQSNDGVNFSTVETVTGTTATISNLTHGHTYYFRVQAYNAGGPSGDSTMVSATP